MSGIGNIFVEEQTKQKKKTINNKYICNHIGIQHEMGHKRGDNLLCSAGEYGAQPSHLSFWSA